MRSLATASATASDRSARDRTLRLAALLGVLAVAGGSAAAADPGGAPRIYRCVIDGKKVTRDRPIAECSDRVQHLLNADGSVNREIQPTLTVEEREKKEQADLAREMKEAKVKQEIRSDRNLMQLYPNEEAHRKARDKALDEFRLSVKNLEGRIALLRKEREPLDLERQFYEPVGKPLPVGLKSKIDANDASLGAQRALVQNQQAEVLRINNTFDIELARLRKLWAGAPPGSLGPLPGTQQAAAGTATPDSAGKTTLK